MAVDFTMLRCPRCGSTNIELQWSATACVRFRDGVIVGVAYAGCAEGMQADGIYCFDCTHDTNNGGDFREHFEAMCDAVDQAFQTDLTLWERESLYHGLTLKEEQE